MKRDNINYLAVGIFVLIAMVTLLAVMYKITGRVGDSDPYHVYYSNITGLSDGSRVTYEGYQVGFVSGVEPEQTADGTRYRVNVQIRRDWKIPDDSVARIYAAGLLAETVINIEEGAARDFLSPDSEISGAQGVDMFAALGSVADDLGGLSRDSIRPLLDNLNRYVTGLGGELESRVPRILADVESTVANLDKSMASLSGLLDTRTESGIRNILNDVETTAENFRALSAGLKSSQTELDALLKDAHGLVSNNDADVRAAVISLRHALDSVSGEVDGILLDLESASRNMNEFTRELRSNPGLLLNGQPPQDKGAQDVH